MVLIRYFFNVVPKMKKILPVVRAGVHSCSPVAPQRRVELFVEFLDGIVMLWPVLCEFGRFLQSAEQKIFSVENKKIKVNTYIPVRQQ